MKELNIGTVLGERRREKGVTQEEVAAFVGVSKASVSKWETGQSYPDITVLPVLASFFLQEGCTHLQEEFPKKSGDGVSPRKVPEHAPVLFS